MAAEQTKQQEPKSNVQAWYEWTDCEAHPVILDGGLGELVAKRGNDILGGSLWSGQLIHSNPAVFDSIADEWLSAGSEILLTATYQVTIEVLCKEFSLTRSEAERSVRGHCDALQRTTSAYWDALPAQKRANRRTPVVGLSLGPLSAIHPDYDEFSSHYGSEITDTVLHDFHNDRVKSFYTDAVKVIAFETIGVTREATIFCSLMRSYADIPFYISFQCLDESHLASGNPIDDAVQTVLGIAQKDRQLVAMGINCVCISMVQELVGNVRAQIETFMASSSNPWRVDVIAYPNSGETYSNRSWGWASDKKSKVHGPLCEEDWASIVHETKARFIGGCCRTNPEHIAALRRVSLAAAAEQEAK